MSRFICLIYFMQLSTAKNILDEEKQIKTHKHEWDYSKNGPSTWAEKYQSCGGLSQSPINIVTKDALPSYYESMSIWYHNYKRKPMVANYVMVNNGHTLQLNLPENTIYTLSKGTKTFIPMQAHIHFDKITGQGSEHTLDSRRYFAEIHLVHKNAKYSNMTDVMKHADGLLVIGIFVELAKNSEKGNSFSMAHKYHLPNNEVFRMFQSQRDSSSFIMALIAAAATELKEPGSNIELPAFPLDWLLPTEKNSASAFDYVNYRGSLTTPPCSEIVDWVVITSNTLKVHESYAKYLGDVLNGNKNKMSGNYRPLQSLFGRQVYKVKGTF